MRGRHALVAGLIALGGCAGGGYQNNQPFNVFANQIQQACYFQKIGTYNVGDLIVNPSSQGNYFIDQLERMFNGRLTAQQFVSGVTGFLDGRESDSGIQCILARLPAPRPQPNVYGG